MIKNGKCNVTKECRLAELPPKIAGRAGYTMSEPPISRGQWISIVQNNDFTYMKCQEGGVNSYSGLLRSDQIGVKAVSSGGRKFCKPIQSSYRPSLQLLCKKSPRSGVK